MGADDCTTSVLLVRMPSGLCGAIPTARWSAKVNSAIVIMRRFVRIPCADSKGCREDVQDKAGSPA